MFYSTRLPGLLLNASPLRGMLVDGNQN
ncbi:TPA: leu operon leader peptide [Yersinia enterocolitica]|uniref:Leu operon leader peptide n=1 Tax=Yersinia enterocolitica TaxID=630 RepID=A0A7T9Y589_YEREN|nr:leu operon leader peptide [Yersinia enterocolitica]MBO0361900.1 leu operon leader peptide [Yersinia enterocolitica subsp. palearctica]EKN3316451.1 leu operon leader peptide [Yersinia enterocolitica]EKN3320573.1 leu operon leader peptide [Yersinia enterocolitica]EKN3324258.1 leu operon leader peptide [Yersinia enterocolitica]